MPGHYIVLVRRKRSLRSDTRHGIRSAMQPRLNFSLWRPGSIFCLIGLAGAVMAQTTPEFTGIQRLTNKETLLKLSGATGVSYWIDASTNLPGDRNSLLTLFSTGVNQYIDSATPFLKARYYRAEQLAGTNHLTGEHLVTT